MAPSTEVLHDLTLHGQCYQRLSRYKVPVIGEILFCEQEPGNKDLFAVAGHQLSKYLCTFN